ARVYARGARVQPSTVSPYPHGACVWGSVGLNDLREACVYRREACVYRREACVYLRMACVYLRIVLAWISMAAVYLSWPSSSFVRSPSTCVGPVPTGVCAASTCVGARLGSSCPRLLTFGLCLQRRCRGLFAWSDGLAADCGRLACRRSGLEDKKC